MHFWRYFSHLLTTTERTIVFLVAIGVLLSVLITCKSSSNPDLRINLEYVDSIASSQNVSVAFTIHNTSDSPVVLYAFNGNIQPAMDGILFFNIIKDAKNTLMCRPAGATPKYPHSGDTIILSPGESHQEVVNLTSFYVETEVEDQPQWDSLNSWGTRRWRPGIYTIRCRYEYMHKHSWKGGRDLWQGSAVSNEVMVRIK